jgi:hypothetical protein
VRHAGQRGCSKKHPDAGRSDSRERLEACAYALYQQTCDQ